MRIENETYIAVIEAARVPNRHDRIHFRYSISRRSASPTLMVSGAAATQEEAASLVRQYLKKFAAARIESKAS